MKTTRSLLAGAFLMLSASVWADSEVTVHYPRQSTGAQVSHAQNLAQLVASPAINGKTWWPGTVISDRLTSAAVMAEKQELLSNLQNLLLELRADDDDMAPVVESVRQQIEAMPVTGRQFVNLDPDWVRLRQEANRPLEGEYDLYTASQPQSVLLAGVVSHPGAQPWQPGKTVAEYLESDERQKGASRNSVVLITPDGQTRAVPVAYWNLRHSEPPAGSIIFVGFSRWTLPGDEELLNQRILSVLTHRIPD